MATDNGNGFTNKEILLQLDKKVDEGFSRLEKLYSEGHGDHENRLRNLEELRSRVLGVVLTISIAVPSLITLVVYHKL